MVLWGQGTDFLFFLSENFDAKLEIAHYGLDVHTGVKEDVSMKHFTELEAWQVGIKLLKEVHALTKRLPVDERFGMTAQLRRCTQSVLANIAEGFGRFTYPDKANKFTISKGEAVETEAFLRMCVELCFFRTEDISEALALVVQEQRILSGLITACRNRS